MGAMLLLAVALSLDGFGVGLSYGLRRIRLPGISFVIISLCTVFTMGISMLLGRYLELFLNFISPRLIGAVLIIGLGGFQLIRAIRKQLTGLAEAEADDSAVAVVALQPVAEPKAALASVSAYPLMKIRLGFFGLVIQVMRTPDLADMDGSGGISLKESFLLGFALALDAFASGIGAALTGMYISEIAVVALTQLFIIRCGQLLAGKIPDRWIKKAEYLPGAVLILVGLGKLL